MSLLSVFLIGLALCFLVPHFYEILGLNKKKQIEIHRDHLGKYPYYFTPQLPVHWFDFQGLLNTFRRVSLSSDILSVIDKREVQANFGYDNKDELFNNKKNENEFWLDFIADTGDGFDATTTVFYHLTRKKYSKNLDENLQSGDALIIGGDLVYPDGSDQNYIDRFKGPIRFVFPNNSEQHQPILLAVPGNHDWYDGLTSFYRMMAQQDTIGNYQTIQNRSYFAYHLGFDYHIMGLDNQLKGDLDIPQIEYFKKYIDKICKPGASLHFILLVAEPYWYSFVPDDYKKRRQRMDSLDYFIRIIKTKIQGKKYLHPIKFKIEIVLTGDMHHYSHYEIENPKEPSAVKHFITSGGGGAFGHATGFLKNKIQLPNLGFSQTKFNTYQLKNKYPSTKESNDFIGCNFLFFLRNFKFTSLVLILSFFSSFGHFLSDNFILKTICILFIPLVLVGTVKQVANPEPSSKEKKHNLILYLSLLVITTLISVLGESLEVNLKKLVFQHIRFNLDEFLIHWIVPSILQSFIMGLYFYWAYKIYGLHVTEISSGKIQEGKKNFLKFKITREDITIYVIGIEEKYDWLKAIKKYGAKKLQKEMQNSTTFDSEGHDEFLSKYFENHKNNLKIIESIKIKRNEN